MPEQAHLYFSPDLETLALRLHERLTEERKRLKPFETITILVPNRNVRRWLSMRLADLDGVSAGIDFLYLEQGLIRALEKSSPAGNQLASQTEVELELCSILCGPDLDEPLASYVRGGPTARTRQLASRLGSLFREYEYHREEWIETWISSAPDSSVSPMARAQALIYRQLMKRLRARGLSTFYSYSMSLMKTAPAAGPRVFVFGISQISRLHARILFHLAGGTGFDLYLADFVLSAGAGSAWKELQPGRIAFPEGEPVLDWMRPQRELTAILQRYAVSAKWFAMRPDRARTAASVFLADSILDAAAGRSSGSFGQGPPIEILAAPGNFREVEAVYCDILGRLKADPSLKLTDIAVLVPDMGKYRSCIESVFERERPALPYSLTDFTSAGASAYARGVECLAELLLEPEFRRSQIAALFRNICFQSAMEFDDREAVEWLRLIDLLGAFRGRGYEDPFTFSSALRRLRLSYVFSLEDDESYCGIVPRGDSFTAAESSGKLSSVFEKLVEGVEQLRGLAAADLADGLQKFIKTFLKVPRNLREEARIEEGLDLFLKRLEDSGLDFDLAMTLELVLSETGGAAGSKGEYLAGGVTVAQLQPMRPIPFRITYVLGMEEGSFPGRPDESTMNLRSLAPEPNDVSLPETNKLLFLESLFGAREHFVICYSCRDPVRDAEYEPCSLVQELVQFAVDRGIPVSSRRLPPHLSLPDQPLRPVYIPAAEAALMHLRRGIEVPPDVRISHAQTPVLSPAGPVPQQVTLKMLTDYLKRPFDAVVKYVARVSSDSRVDHALEDIEPFYSSEFLANTIPRAIVTDFLERGVFTEAALRASGQKVYGVHTRNLELPAGAFGQADLERILERLIAGFRAWGPDLSGSYANHQCRLTLKDSAGTVALDAAFPLYRELPDRVELAEHGSPGGDAGVMSFLYSVALRASGEQRRIQNLVLHNKGITVFEIAPISATDAERYLLKASRDLLSANATFIPLTLLESQRLLDFRGTPAQFAERIEEAMADESKIYSYSDFFSTLPVRLDADALNLARARFGLFVNARSKRAGL